MQCLRCGHDQFDVLIEEGAGGKTLFEFKPDDLKPFPTIQEWVLAMLGLKVSDMFQEFEAAGSDKVWECAIETNYKGDNSDYRFTCLGCGRDIPEEEIENQLVARMRQFNEEQA